MTRIAVVGLGKMGLSHVSIIRAHPDVELAAICDSTGYLLDILHKYTGLAIYEDFDKMLAEVELDGILIATPTHMHASMVRKALERGLHVFCEKPFVLDAAEGQELADLATARQLVTQVGYHNHFVGSFQEVKRLLEAGAIGEVVGGLAEAYGPVVLKPAGRTWRSKLSTGGGALYDYAAHPLDLLTWYLGEPTDVTGNVAPVFSREIDDVVTATLRYPKASVQLNVNWSDESQRKMTTKITLWGTNGRIYADRQEIQVFLRDGAKPPAGYEHGWNVHYTTELTPAPFFYVRGEEYSNQLDSFVGRILAGEVRGPNDFTSALGTDRVIAAIRASSERGPVSAELRPVAQTGPRPAGELSRELLERAAVVSRELARKATAETKQAVSRWRNR
jgi:scyllo-inositol 2-dehydrogenase (NADP+)